VTNSFFRKVVVVYILAGVAVLVMTGVRLLSKRALMDAGFEVVEASNGRKAIELVESEARIDAVLTDLAMPEIGGRDLARRLRTQRPTLPVVFMTGYTDDVVTSRGLLDRGLLDSGVPFLEKPLSPDTIVRTMREVIAASREGVSK
jgi:CheY-like chemotaxis protein